MVLVNVERAVTHARIRITDIVGGVIAMSFGKKEFATFIPKRHSTRSALNDLPAVNELIDTVTTRGVAMATDEVPKTQDASVSRTTTVMKFHNVRCIEMYTRYRHLEGMSHLSLTCDCARRHFPL